MFKIPTKYCGLLKALSPRTIFSPLIKKGMSASTREMLQIYLQ